MYYYVIIDRDGGDVADDGPFESWQEAEDAALFWEDDPRYGSHEIVKADKYDSL